MIALITIHAEQKQETKEERLPIQRRLEHFLFALLSRNLLCEVTITLHLPRPPHGDLHVLETVSFSHGGCIDNIFINRFNHLAGSIR